MKRKMICLVLIFFLWALSFALAQNNPSNTKSPNSHALHKRLRQQMRQIAADLKSGKITEAKAKTERQNLVAVHQQEVQLKKQNGNHELTDSQAKQLNSKLDSTTTQN